MGTKSIASIALFLSFSLLIHTVVSGCGSSCTCPPPPSSPSPPLPSSPSPPSSPSSPSPPLPSSPSPPSIPSPPTGATCPRDALQLGVCANVLDGLLGLILGSPPVEPCCALLEGLVDLEAAICLCTALNANILGINLNVQISLTLLLNVCSREVPPGFLCA